MAKLARLGSLLAAACLVAGCGRSAGSSGPPTPAASHERAAPSSSSSAARSTAPTPRRFTSKAYNYTLTAPAGLPPRPAFATWDGHSELDGGSPYADLFGQPSETSGIWAASQRWRHDLAAYTAFTITWNDHFHGDTCPHPPSRHRITVGGQPGVLLAYNCGILVNCAVTVHHGIGYWFVFVDQGVASAVDPTDRATFLDVLGSVRFPASRTTSARHPS